MRTSVLAMTAAAIVAISGVASAATTITSGSYTLTDDSFGTGFGVHSNGTQAGDALDAHVNQDGSAVTFTSTDSLSETGSGEATIDGPFNNLNASFAKGWDSVTFALKTEKNAPSDLEIFIDGSSKPVFMLSSCSICALSDKGEQKFTLSGPDITDIYFKFSTSIENAKQFRVDGAAAPATPEPATWAMMLLGVALVGGGLRKARREQALSASH